MSDVYDANDLNGFEFDSDTVDPERMYESNFLTKEGYYHVSIEPGISLSKPEDHKLRTVDLKFRILAGCDLDGKDASDQIDKEVSHSIYIESWTDARKALIAEWEKQSPEKRDKMHDYIAFNCGNAQLKEAPSPRQVAGIKTLFFAAGVIGEEELASERFAPKFAALASKQLIVKLTADTYKKDGEEKKGRIKLKWNNDAFPIGHEKVKDVPINGAVALAGGYNIEGAATREAIDDLANSI